MTPEQIKRAVEDYPILLAKQDRLQKRIINLAGRDSDQEVIYMQQLQSIEHLIELIDHVLDSDDILTNKENWAIYRRTEGASIKEITKMLLVVRQRVDQILDSAYKKIANFYNNDDAA